MLVLLLLRYFIGVRLVLLRGLIRVAEPIPPAAEPRSAALAGLGLFLADDPRPLHRGRFPLGEGLPLLARHPDLDEGRGPPDQLPVGIRALLGQQLPGAVVVELFQL